MPFLLNRKWTLPEKNQSDQKKNVSWNIQGKNMSFWSIPENQKQNDEQPMESEHTIINNSANPLKLTKYTSCRSIQDLQPIQKIQDTNLYTVNFLEPHQNNLLPKIKSISKAKRLLATNGQFRNFQKNNLEEGIYCSVIEELERKEETYFHRLSISSKAQIKTRKNVFEMMHLNKNKCLSTNSLGGKTNTICSVKVIEGTNSSYRKQNKITEPYKIPNKTRSKTYDRWKLKDFYDPLLTQFLTDKAKHMALQERQNYMKTVKQIEQKCEKMTSQNQATKYIKIFGRFSEAIDSKLTKKQRKLQKLKEVFKCSDN